MIFFLARSPEFKNPKRLVSIGVFQYAANFEAGGLRVGLCFAMVYDNLK